MPIRQRGNTWQVDVRLPDGSRYRKQAKTEAEAKALEAMLSTTPEQRRAMKRALRSSPAASEQSAALPSSPPSNSTAGTSNPPKSEATISPLPVLRWPDTA